MQITFMMLGSYFLFLLIFVINIIHSSINVCVDHTKLKTITAAALGQARFKVLNNTSLMKCMSDCLRRTRCKSFNYYLLTSTCELNDRQAVTLSELRTESSVLYGSAVDIPQIIAGVCANHQCTFPSECTEQRNGTTSCDIVDCGSPPVISNSTAMFDTNNIPIDIDTILSYTCHSDYYPAGEQKCLPNGTWEDFKCNLKVKTCTTIQRCNPNYIDGEYWFYHEPTGGRIKIFCHGLNTTNPKEYVTLHGNVKYFTQHYTDGDTDDCKYGRSLPNHTFEYCGKTAFQKIGIKNYQELEVDLEDFTFATPGCTEFSPLMVIGDCSKKTGCTDSPSSDFFHFDLRDTGLLIPATAQALTKLPCLYVNFLICL
ncbi:uncharacterized protein LOC126832373 isoform X2 [Patella vulgata]|uniref:uncharacterized protein LOC126832373 isoform X2 n=1 Tax=Patella vulgata TaxID=6465 RepID=UPI0021802256|nr:uncharacterized protein LOC126832373 isoform X2 [Patella vulgata]